MWFTYSLLVITAWGFADLFYKKSVTSEDSSSHLRVLTAVGFVMGIHALYFLIAGKTEYSFSNFITYLPVAGLYILAMAFGFYGFRFVELSIGSPLENTSGAMAAVLTMIFLKQSMTWYQAVAIIVITLSLIFIGTEEKNKAGITKARGRRHWFLILLFPLLYAFTDSLGTFADAYVLENFLTEDQANISYELTFLIVGIAALIYTVKILKKRYVLKDQLYPYLAAATETTGQYFYVHALASNAVIVAPMIASYSAIAVLLGRIILKEKLTKIQWISIFFILCSIFVLGIEI